MEKNSSKVKTDNKTEKILKKIAISTSRRLSVFFMFQPRVPNALKKED